LRTRETRHDVFDDIWVERDRQDAKWGEQSHPDGTGGEAFQTLAGWAKHAEKLASANGNTDWTLILLEEVYEALAESDRAKLREELIQVAAVVVNWVEELDTRV
jgi:hypothetical protein